MSRFAGFAAGHPWLFGGMALLGLIVIILTARAVFGRSWGPVGDLIDATQRLGNGETVVRIRTTQPGPFGAIGASFNRMAARLEEEDERRRRLLADLGHELRTPLTVIRGEIEAVIDGVHPPASLNGVVDEVDLMERLLEDLRVLTLTEAGRLQLHREALEVETLVGDVITSFATAIEARKVRASVEVAVSAGEIEVDPYRMRQVLANLVSNALNQMPDGGVLSISARGSAHGVTIEVGDTGPGIPPDRMEEVFQRFVKAGDSTGTGLGLSIARDLVEAHGGTLEAGNRPGGGALFTVSLPTT
jgi:signal transduction histidine kinase